MGVGGWVYVSVDEVCFYTILEFFKFFYKVCSFVKRNVLTNISEIQRPRNYCCYYCLYFDIDGC